MDRVSDTFQRARVRRLRRLARPRPPPRPSRHRRPPRPQARFRPVRRRELADGAEHVTLVFDKGNNSQENLDWVERGPFHFIGSLVPTQHRGLLAVPASLLREIETRRQRPRGLQRQLRRWRDGKPKGGRKPGVETTRKKVAGWLAARHMRELFTVEVGERDGLPTLRYRFQRRAWERLQDTLLGKTLLCTDNDSWSDAELVRGYRAQHHVESAFRQMKDSDCIAIRPQYHWTDQKIETHVLCCVLALALCGLLQRELGRRGVERSIPALLEALQGIREVDVLYPARKAGGAPVLRSMYAILELDQYAF